MMQSQVRVYAEKTHGRRGYKQTRVREVHALKPTSTLFYKEQTALPMVAIKFVLTAAIATLSAVPTLALEERFWGKPYFDRRLWGTTFLGCVSAEGRSRGKATSVGYADSHQECIVSGLTESSYWDTVADVYPRHCATKLFITGTHSQLRTLAQTARALAALGLVRTPKRLSVAAPALVLLGATK